jgi:hypothetical protein
MTMTPADIAGEESRAALYRAQQARRARFQSELWQDLAGDPEALDDLYASWQALIDYLFECQMPPVDSEDEIDPLGISDTVNVGE